MTQQRIESAKKPANQQWAEHPDEFVLLSSGRNVWDGILLEHLLFPPLDLSGVSAMANYLTLQLGTPKAIELKVNGKFNRKQMVAGNVCLTPIQHLHSIRWHSNMEVLSLTLEPTLIVQAAHESIDPDRVELLMQRGQNDPLIREILLALKAELEAGCPSGRLYGEAMGTAIAVHLLKRYTTIKTNLSEYEDGLSQYKLAQVLEYIESNLEQEIKLTDLAVFVGMSQYYFCRLFKRSMGIAPYQYLLQQRIERSKQLLKQKGFAIADIAHLCGFKNQSHFTTCFRKLTGITPKSYQMH